MKTKEQIMDGYAVNFNYDSWIDLIESELNGVCVHWSKLYEHINAVTDLIQKELLNRVADNKHPFTESILNTPIL